MTALKLASYNIQYGKGKDGRYDLPRIVSDLGHPDIIALQEVERFSARSGMVDQPQDIAALLSHMHWVFGPGIDVDASELVDGKPTHRRRQYGNMVLSRWPILSSVTHPLPKIALAGGVFHQQRCLLETVLATSAGALRFISVHLDHVAPETRLPQVEVMLALAHSADQRGGNWGGRQGVDVFSDAAPPMPRDVVIMGDMNFAPDSPEYARVIGTRSAFHGRLTRSGGLADAWVAAGHPEETGDTFPNPVTTPYRIDHCFLSSRLAPFVAAARVGSEAAGSDHQPIFVDLAVEGALI